MSERPARYPNKQMPDFDIVPAADEDDRLGLSSQEIERLRSGDPSRICSFSEPDSSNIQPKGETRLNLLLQGQGELLELCTQGQGRGQLLDYVAGLAQRVLGPCRCAIQILDHSAGLQCYPAVPPSPIAGSQIGKGQSVGACWTHPIQSSNHKFEGAITIYRLVTGDPDNEDRRVLDVLATMVRFVIQAAEREEALRGANTRFAALAESIPGVVYQRRVTPDGDIRYTYISEGARDIFGVTAEEILNDPKALFDCHGPEYRADFRERLLAASRNLKMWDVEAQIVTASGEEKWTHAIARPHLDRDGSVLWDGVILDATRIKRAEFELRDAKVAAEAANRAKTLFLAQVGHELRTPLNAVIGFAELLGRQPLGPIGHSKYEEYARDIEESGRHLLSLINSILDYTRIETGEMSICAQEIDVKQVINKIYKEAEPVANGRDIKLYKSIANDASRINGDEDKIERIVRTLVSNAIKFTADGGEVRVDAHRDMDANFVLSVADTGIGIVAEDIPKMFQPFAQIDNELNRRYDGIGLGMTLASAIAQLHGGSISVDSKIGQGTKVTLTLPNRSVAN